MCSSDLTKTGNDFAVNAYTGAMFKLQRDRYDRLSLTEIVIEYPIADDSEDDDSEDEE